MKKKLIACLGMLGLALTSLFVSPISSNAATSSHTGHSNTTSISEVDLVSGNYDVINLEKLDYRQFVTTQGMYNFPAYELFAINRSDYDNCTYTALQSNFIKVTNHFVWDTANVHEHVTCCDSSTMQVAHKLKFEAMNCYVGYFKKTFNCYASIHIVDLWCGITPDRTAPTITGTNLISVNVDSLPSQADILSNIEVTDDTDDNPTLEVVSSNYDSSNRTLGDYSIVVRGVDASGNTSANYTITVRVLDTTKPTITGTNLTAQANNVHLQDYQILGSQFKVSDNYNSASEITKVLTRNDYEAKWNIPGVYLVECKATDTSGNFASATISITVVDKTPPTISGTNKTQPNNVKLSTDEILALFTASDDVSLKSKRLIDNSYSANWNIPGTYTVECEAFDTANNRTTAFITITVEDKVAPTITGENKTVTYYNKITDLKSLFTIADDVTSLENLKFEILTDTYTASFNKKGSYVVKAKVTDEAGNYAQAEVTLSVIDDRAPVIVAPSEVELGNSRRYTDEELRASITITDEYDGAILDYTITDDDNYALNYKTPGTYTRVIKAVDSSGNERTFPVPYKVKDDTSPEVWLNRYFIVASEGEAITEDQIMIYVAKSLGVEAEEIASIEGLSDEYEVGTYELAVTLYSGEAYTFNLAVKPNNPDNEEPAATEDGFFSTKDYASKLFDFKNWKEWTFWIWFTYIGGGLAIVGFFILRKKFKK
ncbi:MAG: hypothetical protein NC310_08345 [Roseburia sp.]|nr:hypothetical protein [Anaeroplasma bactoclasticum]MCM1197059.1 hypothetical protein [Roseburia sp.]MCM1557914.1 hypothetical protein [Anaeroplasma bactoclasticum]